MSEPDTCSCFPGTCRGGDVVDGRLASGTRCKQVSQADARGDEAVRQWHRECDDGDALLRMLGLDPTAYRTDGGSINLPKVREAICPRPAQVPRVPNGYFYRYHSIRGGTELHLSGGRERNGSKPIEAVPYYLGTPPATPAASAGPHVALVQFLDGLLLQLGREPTEAELRAAAHTLTVRADRIACAAARCSDE